MDAASTDIQIIDSLYSFVVFAKVPRLATVMTGMYTGFNCVTDNMNMADSWVKIVMQTAYVYKPPDN